MHFASFIQARKVLGTCTRRIEFGQLHSAEEDAIQSVPLVRYTDSYECILRGRMEND